MGQTEEILEGKWFEVEKWLGEVKSLEEVEEEWLARGKLEHHRYQCDKLKTTDDLAGSMSLTKHPSNVWNPSDATRVSL